MADAFAVHFADVSATSRYSPEFQKFKNIVESVILDLNGANTEWYNAEFTMEDLDCSLK